MAKGNTIYDNMEFPDYEFRDYPAAIPLDEDGNPTKDPYVPGSKPQRQRPVVIVQDEEEFTRLLGGNAKVVGERLQSEDDEKAELLTSAAQVGAKVSRNWSVERIRKAIDDHVAGEHPL